MALATEIAVAMSWDIRIARCGNAAKLRRLFEPEIE